MPILDSSSYKPSYLLKVGHFSTILPNIFRKVTSPKYKRIRIDTLDDDFLDLDHANIGGEVLVILTHGLEGNSNREYISAMVNGINENGWDALAINLRGCSGMPNNLYSSYHSGKSADLDLVINYVLDQFEYHSILLIGYSLGGNITLKYVGEKGQGIDSRIKATAAVSVPIMLEDSAYELAKKSNWIYMNRFVRKLQPKLKEKLKRFPQEEISYKDVRKMRSFYDFDSMYTAPAHGFSSAKEYWEKSSSRPYISKISIPTLLINAQDDPFLAESSFPYAEAQKQENFFLLAPKYGGHVGFMSRLNEKGEFWHEREIISFFEDNVKLK